MARLAAYYQEDFQYPPVGHGHKQRKSSYVFYEEPRNNLFNNYVLNGERLRSLATSEPSLSPLSHTSMTDKMTLKNKSIVYGSQLIESSHPPMQYFDNDHNAHYPNDRFARLQDDLYDNECLYTDDRTIYNDRYIPRYRNNSKNKSHKRFSYAEPQNNSYTPEVYISQNYDRYPYHGQIESNFNVYDNRYQHPSENYVLEPSQNSVSPRSSVYIQSRSNQGDWQQWPITSDEVFVNRSLLSPPSPLDSGLSSQSITSSPSLEADSFPSHAEAVRSERDHACLCPNQMFSDARTQGVNLSRHDSGRSSSMYSAYRYPKESHRLSNNVPNGVKHLPQIRNEFYHNGHHSSQIRYGKLGLLGEPTNIASINNMPQKKHGHSGRHEKRTVESMYQLCFEAENGIASSRRTPSRMSQSHNHQQKCEKPFVAITEAPEKNTDYEGPFSPELDNSEKSDMDSSNSPTVSNSTSKSSSVSSSNNELNCNERRKPNRTSEKEIRELEDMYEKCNLSDIDLLDRAERRDLPTAHQGKSNHKLKRSKSDTLYETISATFHNPYETPQRAPPLRRSGMPDRVADDMALRKLRKSSSARTSSSNTNKNTITYMLCSSHFTPTVPNDKDILLMNYPDVEFDDLSYRKHYFGKKSKVADPQPPFGIPLRPPPQQKVFTDYLHAIPSDAPQPICHPRGNPDVVRDDFAFRALRKDEPERIYYDISQMYKMKKVRI